MNENDSAVTEQVLYKAGVADSSVGIEVDWGCLITTESVVSRQPLLS